MSLYNPLWILRWHGLHTGICFLFKLDINLVNPVDFTLPFRICFISTLSVSPHTQHKSKGLICDLKLQFVTSKGSTFLVADFANNFVFLLKLPSVNNFTDLVLSSFWVSKYLPYFAKACALLGKFSFLAIVLAHEWCKM